MSTVVIIGGGPVGLVSAYQWILRGKQVTLYDSRLPSEASRPQIILLAKQNWELLPQPVQERLKSNGACILATDDNKIMCSNDPLLTIIPRRGERGGRGRTTRSRGEEEKEKEEKGWKGSASVRLSSLQSEMFAYLVNQYSKSGKFQFIHRAFSRWSDIDQIFPQPELILIADGGGRESLIHQIPELKNTYPSNEPLGYGATITFDLNVSNLQQYLADPNAQQWLASQQLVVMLRTLVNHMYIILQMSEKSGEMLAKIGDPSTKWESFLNQVPEGKLYRQLLQYLPILDVTAITRDGMLPQLNVFPIRLRSLLQFTTLTPFRKIPVFVLGDAAFTVHYFTASGLNNGLIELHYLLNHADSHGLPPQFWMEAYQQFVTNLRHETWVNKTPDIYVDVDQLIKDCDRGNPSRMVDCMIQAGRIGPSDEQKTIAKMNAYVTQLSRRGTISPQISSLAIYEQKNLSNHQLFQMSVADKKDALYKTLASEWLKSKSGQTSIFNSPSGYHSPPVDPDSKYDYKPFLDLTVALANDGVIVEMKQSPDGRGREFVISANSLNTVVPTVLTKFGYINPESIGPSIPRVTPIIGLPPSLVVDGDGSSWSNVNVPRSFGAWSKDEDIKELGWKYLDNVTQMVRGRVDQTGGTNWIATLYNQGTIPGEQRVYQGMREAKEWIETGITSPLVQYTVIPTSRSATTPIIAPNPVNRILAPVVPVRAENVLPAVVPPLPAPIPKNEQPRFTDDGYDFLLGEDIPTKPSTGMEFVLDARTFDIIHFWVRQMQEQAELIALKIEDKVLKKRARDITNSWKQFYVQLFGPTRIEPDKIALDENDWKRLQLSMSPQNIVWIVMNGIAQTAQLKKEILNQLTRGVWLGDLTPMYAAHMLRKVKHFRRDLIEGSNMPAKDRIQFWDITSGEHAALTGREMDPKMRNNKDKRQGTNFYKDFLAQVQRTSDGATSVAEADAASTKKITELRDWTLKNEQGLKNHTLMGTLHPQLEVEHNRREADRALYELQQLRKPRVSAVALPISVPAPMPVPSASIDLLPTSASVPPSSFSRPRPIRSNSGAILRPSASSSSSSIGAVDLLD